MAAFAVTTVDWSNQRRSYLDNFINYVLAVIPTDSPTATPRDAIRPLIIERFNLYLPANIVHQLVRRAIRLEFLSPVASGAVALTDRGKREVSPIPYALKKLEREQRIVAQRFAEWAADEVGVVIDEQQATAILLDYVETYYCSLMSLSDGEGLGALNLPLIEPTPNQKIAAAFVFAMNDSAPEIFDSIADMARGSMMVNALYAPNLVDTTRGFRGTTIYLDTKVVLRALGYEGEPAQQATTDLVGVLARQNARLAVFEFTLREIQSVLDAVAQKARGGRIWDSRPGTVESYFYRINASNAQIEQHSVRVESKILAMGMHVDPSPAFENHRFVVDEAAIERLLLQGNPNYRPTALRHDVQLISAVVRARGGRARGSLEESRATFMTLNSLVVNTARLAQREYNETWPIAMFENDIAALTWVKEPLAAPNLPKSQLYATSLGLTNPGKHDWSLYISEIGRLLDSGEITDNDLILLRQKYERDSLAFVGPSISTSDAERKVEIRASIESARAAVGQELTGPIRAENALLSEELSAAQEQSDFIRRESAANREEANRLLGELLKPVWRSGGLVDVGIRLGLLLACLAGVAVTFVPGAEQWLTTLPGGVILVVGVRIVGIAAVILGGLWGPIAHLGATARVKFIVARLKKLGVSPERAAEAGYFIVKPANLAPTE